MTHRQVLASVLIALGSGALWPRRTGAAAGFSSISSILLGRGGRQRRDYGSSE